MCFLRHLPGEAACETFRAAEEWLHGIIGVGLDSSEVDHPPEDFAEAYAMARAAGLRPVAHAGEEGPPAYITGALDALGAQRIDHGVRCTEDPDLVARLVAAQTPLTVCPLSNLALCVVDDLADHNLKRLLDAGLKVTINSDDPAYFGGYVADNYHGGGDRPRPLARGVGALRSQQPGGQLRARGPEAGLGVRTGCLPHLGMSRQGTFRSTLGSRG